MTTTSRLKTNPARANSYTISVMGDSLTYNYIYAARPEQLWPEQLAALLRNQGALIKARNFAKGGNTTGPFTGEGSGGDMIGRFAWMTTHDVPDIAVIFGGVNDPTSLWDSSSAPTKSTNITTTVSSGATTTSIPVVDGSKIQNGQALILGSGASILQTTVTSGGGTNTLTVPLLAYAPTTGTAVGQGTQPNLQYMIQMLLNVGCLRIVVLNTQYLNWVTGGDTTGTAYATYSLVRPYQAAAVTAIANSGVVLCDLYASMKALIGGTFTYAGVTYSFADHAQSTPQYGVNLSGGSSAQSWHIADQNQHPNVLGHAIIAQAVYTTITAQSGWLAAVSK